MGLRKLRESVGRALWVQERELGGSKMVEYQLITHGVIAPLYTSVVGASWEARERPWFHLGAMGAMFNRKNLPWEDGNPWDGQWGPSMQICM